MGISEEYIPFSFSFKTTGILTEDLEAISAINKIVLNLRTIVKCW
ncbi:MAG: hypothetical protein K0R15_2093 [Clostridiales bacterium]|nr:hypothetical protein [Clostridiales bacterium]